MTNKTIDIKINKSKDVEILMDNKVKIKVTLKNKSINIKDLFEMLNYEINNHYILNSKKYNDDEIKGKENEDKRLYNYIFELLEKIIDNVNKTNESGMKELKRVCK